MSNLIYFINSIISSFIEYKYYYNENDINIFEFIKMRNEIYNKISILMKLDFIQNNKLLIKIRNYQNDYIKNI